MTEEEKLLLEKMKSGSLDGKVGDSFKVGESVGWFEIVDGIPTQFKKGPGGKFLMARKTYILKAL